MPGKQPYMNIDHPVQFSERHHRHQKDLLVTSELAEFDLQSRKRIKEGYGSQSKTTCFFTTKKNVVYEVTRTTRCPTIFILMSLQLKDC
mmetsp:Transcript_8111/g.16856  ORF Transcript_8111/g.16856 Transcript_8111/m.16856 type:complete len:89 (-) Transcript_8111:187-453(-)